MWDKSIVDLLLVIFKKRKNGRSKILLSPKSSQMQTGPPPTSPRESGLEPDTFLQSQRETDRAGSRARPWIAGVCRLARWVHFTALQQYVSLLPGAVLCRGRGSLKLLAEAGPAVSLLPAASSPEGRASPHGEQGMWPGKRARVIQYFRWKPLLHPQGQSWVFFRWEFGGGGGGTRWVFSLGLRKLLLKNIFSFQN